VAVGYGEYGDYDGNCRVVLGDGGAIRTAIVLGHDDSENLANARLIAAAPELLAFAKLFLEDYQSEEGMNSMKRYAKAAYEAIAKAEGKA
jgi:hypothetical protein